MSIEGNLKISIIVRTYLRPKFLNRALLSIELQTYNNWEVIVYDDSGNLDNLKIVNDFKNRNKDKRVLYITSFTPLDLFKNSWKQSIYDSNGDVLVRLDDDDILDTESLDYINSIYVNNPNLDFSYGSAAIFKNNKIFEIIEAKTPHELEKTREIWAAYTIKDNHPWNNPWTWIEDYYESPQHFTSIIHASKSNELCIYATHVMRKDSVKKVIDKFEVTSIVDDLEFFGSLEYLGLSHCSIKKILSYVESHDKGRMTQNSEFFDEINRVRDKVDYLRINDFKTNILNINQDNNEKLEINEQLVERFNSLIQKLSKHNNF
jgi:glycosyltransferase involved in cell wall biosynthesis